MSRVVITKTVAVPAAGGQVAHTVHQGEVLEVNAAEAAAISGAGGSTRATTTATAKDQLGEAFGVSNGN